MNNRTTLLAATAALCQLLPRDEAGEISAEAASLRLECTVSIMAEDVDQLFRTVVPLALEAWRKVAMQTLHEHTFPVLKVLFEISPRTIRSQMAVQVWEMLAHRIHCHVTLDRRDLVWGRSMVDFAAEWVFRHIDFRA